MTSHRITLQRTEITLQGCKVECDLQINSFVHWSRVSNI